MLNMVPNDLCKNIPVEEIESDAEGYDSIEQRADRLYDKMVGSFDDWRPDGFKRR